MLLRTANPAEAQLRQQLVNVLGATDEATLTAWMWDNHKHAFPYVEALHTIVAEAGKNGPQFLKNLLAHCKKPKEQRELEKQILEWFAPRAQAAANTVIRHNRDPEVAKKEGEQLAAGLLEFLTSLFPDKHEATLRGAAMTGFTHGQGGFTVNFAQISKLLLGPDPLRRVS